MRHSVDRLCFAFWMSLEAAAGVGGAFKAMDLLRLTSGMIG